MQQDIKIVLSANAGNLPAVADQASKSLAKIGAAGEISARQTAAAMRTLPAQFTDIATQLAGGQNPLLILLQQGGQIKDSFGGVGNAFRALASAVNPMTVALGGAAAALGAIAVGFVQGQREAQAYRQSIVLSGNAIGTTTDQLADMAARLDDTGTTQKAAAEALALLAANSLVSANNIERVADSALRMQRATGTAVGETIKQFQELGKAPLQASVKLNESTNFLTNALYDQIAALEKQGRTAEAAAVAQNAYADAMDKRTGELTKNLGSIERGFNSAKQAAAEMWDAILGIGRDQTISEQIKAIEKDLAERQARGPLNSTTGAAFERGQERLRLQLEGLKEVERLSRRSATAQAAEAEAVRDYVKAAEERRKEDDRRRGKKPGTGDPRMGPQTFDEMFPAADVGAIQRYQRDNLSAQRQFFNEEKQAYTARDEALREDRQKLEKRITLDLEDENYKRSEAIADSISEGILDGFRDGRGFADVFLRELKAQFAKTILSPLIRPTVEAGNNLIEDLLRGAVGAIVGGGMTIDTSGAGTISPDLGQPRGGMATGTNYVPRDMLALVHKGEAIVPAKYNTSGAGRALNLSISIDARSDQAQVQSLVVAGVTQGLQQYDAAQRAQGR